MVIINEEKKSIFPFLLVLFVFLISSCSSAKIKEENYEVTEEEFKEALDFTDDNYFRSIFIQNHYIYGEEIVFSLERYNNVSRQPKFQDNKDKGDVVYEKNN